MQTDDGPKENPVSKWIYICPECYGLCRINHSPEESVGSELIYIRCPHCRHTYPATLEYYVIIKEGETQ